MLRLAGLCLSVVVHLSRVKRRTKGTRVAMQCYKQTNPVTGRLRGLFQLEKKLNTLFTVNNAWEKFY